MASTNRWYSNATQVFWTCEALTRGRTNNGSLYLSHRGAAKALNVARDTLTRWFHELEASGFIRKTGEHHLGSSGIRQASTYALEEEPCDGKPATKAYMSLRAKQNRRPKSEPGGANSEPDLHLSHRLTLERGRMGAAEHREVRP